MLVLAETNFVLELAFKRDKFACCAELVDMAEHNRIKLCLPAYSLVEPYETLIRRRNSRKQLHGAISDEVREIARSAHVEERAKELAELTALLIDVGEVERTELDQTVSRLLGIASFIDLSAEVLLQSFACREHIGLSPQDSIVYASVLSTLHARDKGPACFVTRNKKDFAVPDITEALDQHDCKLLFDFERALDFVRHQLGLAEQGTHSP